ncbi:MAG TPA: NOL1/NOP2/sun family putative RNA methylase [Gemmatimonadota bacterium]|nr:NOL1/NOP2/sun family putative RNA methylase [Gemmatimonadota bacterium]
MALERYLGIVPDPEGFRAALERPEPTTVRVRMGRASERVVERLERQGFGLEAVPGLSDVFHVRSEPFPISKTLEHWMGHIYIQQASTAAAAPALGVRPGERVLDLCAAPGGKTTHLSDLLGERGCLVASDPAEKRLRALLGNIYRLGHAGILVVAADGRDFPDGASFDRILVDAPCSAEGNVRRQGGETDRGDADFRDYVTSLQGALLRRAVDLVRPGGVVLYSTCTFAPEENEAVVDRILRERPVSVEPIDLGVPHAPGLVRHGERRFHPDLEAAWRIYPHHLDSGGLFLARLRKGGGDGPAAGGGAADAPGGWTPVPPAYPGEGLGGAEARERIGDARSRLSASFGVPGARFEAEGWMARGDSVWGHRLSAWPLEAWEASDHWRFVSLGVRVMREDRRYGLRPTNDGLRWLDRDVRRRRVPLDHRGCLRLLEGGLVRSPVEGGNGNVALAVDGEVVGRGVIRGDVVRHEIPRPRARRLREILSDEVTRAARASSAERRHASEDGGP